MELVRAPRRTRIS